MILERNQTRRFISLVNSLLMFSATDLEVADLEGPTDISLTGNDTELVSDALWGIGGDTSAIDRYVEMNPQGLNRTDLREIASWKSGLLERFAMVRDGNDVYLMIGGYGFAVRGVRADIDYIIQRNPAYVTTALLPFDGLITYALNFVTNSDELEPGEEEAIMIEFGNCKAQRHLVRTSRQFIQAAPLAAAAAPEQRRRKLRPKKGDFVG